MHVCYLRVSGDGFDVDAFTSRSNLAIDSQNLTKWHKGEPFRRDVRQDSGFMLEICMVESEGLEEQTAKAINFLKTNFEELRQLMEQADNAYLQFIIDKRDVANQNDLFPAELIRLSGSLGLGILLSQYA